MTILERITNLVASAAGVEAAEVKPDTKLADLPIDSLEFSALVKDVEEEFHVVIEPKDVLGLNTPDDFVSCIQIKCQ